MPDLFELINRYHAAHAERISLTPMSVTAVAARQLARQLADLSAADRAAVLELLRDEILAIPVTA